MVRMGIEPKRCEDPAGARESKKTGKLGSILEGSF
jgi:hypothetical protein